MRSAVYFQMVGGDQGGRMGAWRKQEHMMKSTVGESV